MQGFNNRWAPLCQHCTPQTPRQVGLVRAANRREAAAGPPRAYERKAAMATSCSCDGRGGSGPRA
ncbi:hypothetical protein EYF80_062744 [Liparis tanakae]|uniref:Uncharacterized protein n=1 Tax=Liparis tanakae TaxID=230148 RepID=A0A4Z2EEG2_9TELE|nr:hypothetical protein EYF80_062744 [Liparis tanakae]